MVLYKYFFHNYRETGQGLVYEAICGRDRSYPDAKAAAKKRKLGVRKLAGLDMLMAYLMSQRSSGENQGWGQKLVNLFLSGLQEVWDLVNHYMLPAIAIDRLTLTDGVKKMKDLRDQVPETLVGVYGKRISSPDSVLPCLWRKLEYEMRNADYPNTPVTTITS